MPDLSTGHIHSRLHSKGKSYGNGVLRWRKLEKHQNKGHNHPFGNATQKGYQAVNPILKIRHRVLLSEGKLLVISNRLVISGACGSSSSSQFSGTEAGIVWAGTVRNCLNDNFDRSICSVG